MRTDKGKINDHHSTRLYGALMAIIFLLKKIHPKTEWQHRFAQLVATKVLPKEISTAAAGFPDGWQDAPIWR